MPVLDYQAIHLNPIVCIKYVTNPQKTNNKELVSSSFGKIETDEIYKEFKFWFTRFESSNFDKTVFRDQSIESRNNNFEIYERKSSGKNEKQKFKSKEKIRIHQYFQSFSEEDSRSMTAEQAHKLGEQLCKEVFGESRSYVVSTHTDKKHLHNHILVCPFDCNGKRWYANNTSLYLLRKISDRIALEHGLHIIEHPKHKNTMKYYEWIKRQQGISWKDEMRKDIDIAAINANDIDELLEELGAKGYKIKKGKYLSLQVGLNKIRSYRLGDGYSLEDLQYRIKNKNAIIDNYKYKSEMQFSMACYVEYLHKAKKNKKSTIGYAELRKNADLLLFLDKNNIQTEQDLENVINNISEKYEIEKEEMQSIKREINLLNKIIENAEEYVILLDAELNTPQKRKRWQELKFISNSGYRLQGVDDIDKLKEKLSIFERRLIDKEAVADGFKQQRKEATDMAKLYLKNIAMTDYDRVVNEIKIANEKQNQIAEYAKQFSEKNSEKDIQNEKQYTNLKTI